MHQTPKHNRQTLVRFLVDAFSSREPVSTSLENAIRAFLA
jgi:hypothetical protein